MKDAFELGERISFARLAGEPVLQKNKKEDNDVRFFIRV